MGASFEAVTSFCASLRARIRSETGLVASIGAGNGKQIAKIASDEAKPDGLLVVPQGTEREFLAPLPVRALWGIGPVAEGKLRFIGVQTLGQLAALSEKDAVGTLGGVVGRDLRLLATGFDDRPVADRGETKQVSAETTFDIDIKDLATLREQVRRIAVGAHQRLVKAERVARTVVIKLRHTDMHTVTRSRRSPRRRTTWRSWSRRRNGSCWTPRSSAASGWRASRTAAFRCRTRTRCSPWPSRKLRLRRWSPPRPRRLPRHRRRPGAKATTWSTTSTARAGSRGQATAASRSASSTAQAAPAARKRSSRTTRPYAAANPATACGEKP